jgi:hypothetical protein
MINSIGHSPLGCSMKFKIVIVPAKGQAGIGDWFADLGELLGKGLPSLRIIGAIPRRQERRKHGRHRKSFGHGDDGIGIGLDQWQIEMPGGHNQPRGRQPRFQVVEDLIVGEQRTIAFNRVVADLGQHAERGA